MADRKKKIREDQDNLMEKVLTQPPKQDMSPRPRREIPPVISTERFDPEMRAEIAKRNASSSETPKTEPTPSSIESLQSRVMKIIGSKPPAKARSEVENTLKAYADQIDKLPAYDADKFTNKLTQLEKAYEENKDNINMLAIAERMGQALAQLGAGLHGMKTGTDMSGLQFDKVDWEKRLDRALGEFRVKQQDVQQQRTEALGQDSRRNQLILQAQQVAQQAAQADDAQARQDQAMALRAVDMLERARQQDEMLDLRRWEAGAKRAKLTKEQRDEGRKRLQANLKRYDNDVKTLDKVITQLADDEKLDTSTTAAAKIKAQLGLPQSVETVQQHLKAADNAWFFGSDVDPGDAAELLRPLIQKKYLATERDVQAYAKQYNMAPDQVRAYFREQGMGVE